MYLCQKQKCINYDKKKKRDTHIKYIELLNNTKTGFEATIFNTFSFFVKRIKFRGKYVKSSFQVQNQIKINQFHFMKFDLVKFDMLQPILVVV